MTVTTIGIDLAKNVFQVHGVDTRGHVVLRKQVTVAVNFEVETAVLVAGLSFTSKNPTCIIAIGTVNVNNPLRVSGGVGPHQQKQYAKHHRTAQGRQRTAGAAR